MTSIITRILAWLSGLFAAAEPPATPATPSPAAAQAPDDIEILGLFRHYTAREPEACIPYTDLDPNVYPDVWVIGRELRSDTHYLIGLEVDGYTVPLEDVQSIQSREASDDLRIAIIRYPRYDRYRRPGTHEVNVLIGQPTEDRRVVQWVRKVPYQVRTVSGDD